MASFFRVSFSGIAPIFSSMAFEENHLIFEKISFRKTLNSSRVEPSKVLFSSIKTLFSKRNHSSKIGFQTISLHSDFIIWILSLSTDTVISNKNNGANK
jgi:hypothetical protein